MKTKKIMIGIFLGFSLLELSSCKPSGLKMPNQPHQQLLTKISRTQSKPKQTPKQTRVTSKEEETFVQQFLNAYTTYTSLNSQKAAVKPLLTAAMQKRLAVNKPVSPDLNQVTSNGQELSIWHNDKGQWLGLVTIKINNQTSSVQVFLVGLEIQGKRILVNQLSSPTQE